MTLITVTLFCSEADMQRMFSAQGVLAFSDHNQDGSEDAGVVDDCRTRASSEIADLSQGWYTPDALATSPTINRWATVMSVRYLCQLRGNPVPESVEMQYQEIMGPGGLLNRLQSGSYKLAGIPTRASLVPTFSNLEVDRRLPYTNIRTTPSSSPEPTTRTQNTSLNVPGAYGY